MKNYAIIVAGGSGSRMNAALPKQFLQINGRPVLMHTIEAFYCSEVKPEILVVLNINYHSFWKELCVEFGFTIPHVLVEGGSQRFDSVKNALNLIQEESLVAVHDAVRPVIDNSLIVKCFSLADQKGAVIPVVESRDSLRKREEDHTIAVRREDMLIVQTPQVFRSDILKKAYEQAYRPEFTDDASVVEKCGISITVTEGDYKNLKITYQDDLKVAALFLK